MKTPCPTTKPGVERSLFRKATGKIGMITGLSIMKTNGSIDICRIQRPDPLFLKTGFIEEYRTDKIIMLKKDLKVFSDEIHG